MRALVVTLVGFPTIVWAQSAPGALVPGAYDVSVHLEMSYGGDPPEPHKVCLTDGKTTPAQGLFILTPDTPISHCPVRNVRRSAERIDFDVICENEGTNAGKASASFDVTGDAFQGRIDMLFGGKNMRMTEVQSGRRVGDCPTSGANQAQ